MRIYLAGPMRGIPQCNFPAFLAAEDSIFSLEEGHVPVNPARISFALWKKKNLIPRDARIEEMLESIDDLAPSCAVAEYLREDFRHLLRCDAIALLPGWEKSEGANKELTLATWLGLKVFTFKEGQPYPYVGKENYHDF